MRWQNPRLWSLREGWPSYRGALSAFSATLCAHRLLSVLLGLPSSADTANQLRTADIQCTWGKETAKKARTQQHFESLENYIRALEAKVKDLQADLEYCRRNHGGLPPSGSSDAAGSTSGPVVTDDAIRASGSDEANNDDGGSSNNESDIDHLISPTRHLVVCPIFAHIPLLFFLWCSMSPPDHFVSHSPPRIAC